MRLEIVVTMLTLVVMPLAQMAGTRAEGPGLRVIVVPPWRDAEDVARAARVQPVGPTRSWLGLFVAVDRDEQVAGLAEAGAWFVLDAERLKWVCGGGAV